MDRRKYLQAVGAAAGGLVVGGALGWLAKPTEGITGTITETVTKTITGTQTITPTPTRTPVSLRFLHMWWMEQDVKLMDDICSQFQTKYPNTTLKVTRTSWADGYRDLLTMIKGGVPPDVSHMGSTWHVEFQGMGAMEPLNDYIPKELKDDIYESTWNFWTVDGDITGIPFITDPWGLTYRADLYEEAGLDPNEPPETWDEFIEYSKLLTKPEKNQWGLGTYCELSKVQWNWTPIMYMAGCDLLVKEDGKWRSTISTEEGLLGMETWTDLVLTHKVMPAEVIAEGFSSTLEGILTGKYAQTIMGLFISTNLVAAEGFGPEAYGKRWANAVYPLLKVPATLTSNHAYSMFSASEHKAEAWELLDWLTNKENMLAINKSSNAASPRKSNLEDAFYKEPWMVARAECAPYMKGHPLCPAFAEIMEKVYAPTVQEAMLGQRTVKDAAEYMDSEATVILKRLGLA